MKETKEALELLTGLGFAGEAWNKIKGNRIVETPDGTYRVCHLPNDNSTHVYIAAIRQVQENTGNRIGCRWWIKDDNGRVLEKKAYYLLPKLYNRMEEQAKADKASNVLLFLFVFQPLRLKGIERIQKKNLLVCQVRFRYGCMPETLIPMLAQDRKYPSSGSWNDPVPTKFDLVYEQLTRKGCVSEKAEFKKSYGYESMRMDLTSPIVKEVQLPIMTELLKKRYELTESSFQRRLVWLDKHLRRVLGTNDYKTRPHHVVEYTYDDARDECLKDGPISKKSKLGRQYLERTLLVVGCRVYTLREMGVWGDNPFEYYKEDFGDFVVYATCTDKGETCRSETKVVYGKTLTALQPPKSHMNLLNLVLSKGENKPVIVLTTSESREAIFCSVAFDGKIKNIGSKGTIVFCGKDITFNVFDLYQKFWG